MASCVADSTGEIQIHLDLFFFLLIKLKDEY